MKTTTKMQRGDKVMYQGQLYSVWYARGNSAKILLVGQFQGTSEALIVAKAELEVVS